MAYRVATAAPAGYAPWSVPAQPGRRRPDLGRRIGWAAAGIGFAALIGVGVYRLLEGRQPEDAPPQDSEEVKAARRLAGGAAVLAFSVLADSGIEHFRGGFHNPAMYVAPSAAAMSLVHHTHMLLTPHVSNPARLALSGLSLATGLTGFAFHVYNVAKREGGVRLVNLFYGAPVGAPVAIALSGLAGLAAAQLVAEAEEGAPPTLLGLPGGKAVGVGTAAAMVGTAAEAWLLHFRGAFHDPFMFVPVTVPPAAAAALAIAAFRPKWRGAARRLLQATAGAGIAGAGFHVYGVSRNMGGFYNWSQNVLNGPPIPAPPSFTGVALAGLAAIQLMAAA